MQSGRVLSSEDADMVSSYSTYEALNTTSNPTRAFKENHDEAFNSSGMNVASNVIRVDVSDSELEIAKKEHE
jgi:hypothetical protein